MFPERKGLIIMLIGIVLIMIGGILTTVSETRTHVHIILTEQGPLPFPTSTTVYPYRSMGVGVAIVGLFIIVVGGRLWWKELKSNYIEGYRSVQKVNKYCGHCGKQLIPEADYCSYCGSKN